MQAVPHLDHAFAHEAHDAALRPPRHGARHVQRGGGEAARRQDEGGQRREGGVQLVNPALADTGGGWREEAEGARSVSSKGPRTKEGGRRGGV